MRITLSVLLSSLVAVTPSAADNCPDPSLRTYDVIVVGAGTSGTMAAIQAARRPNTAVALIESLNVIGGQIVASGVTTMDGGLQLPVRSGLFLEYIQRVNAHYAAIGLATNTCYGRSELQTCSEPHVSEQILIDMLEDDVAAGSTLCRFLNTTVVEVLQDPLSPYRVTGVRTGTGPTHHWSSHVVIDATEYGDLLPMTLGDYRVGNWRRFSGTQPSPYACVQDITYTAIIRKYAPTLPVPQIPAPGGYDPMENVFWTWVTDNPPPFPGHPYPYSCPWDWLTFNSYRGLPDSANAGPSVRPPITRSQSNYEVTDFPGYWVEDCRQPNPIVHSRGDLAISFIENPAVRLAKICEAKHLSMQFLHYMQRANPEEQPEWSIADDEYVSPNVCYGQFETLGPYERQMPPMPYVRESRRIVPLDYLQGFEIKRTANGTESRHHTSLAVGDYASQDMHGCTAPENLESDLDTPGDFTVFGGPFQIPFETFIPAGLDGFLPAEKNLGYSRIAATAARMQPSTMLVGQAAGALAALAAKGYPSPIQPRAVRVLDVQRTLLEDEDPVALAVETFTDVPIGDPSWRDAQLVAIHEVMDGFIGGPYQFQFRVHHEATRDEVITVLTRLFPPPAPTVPSGTYVRRDDVVRALVNGLWGGVFPPEPGTPPIFLDVPAQSCPPGPNCLRGAIERLYTDGFVLPCTASDPHKWFCPTGLERRGWLAHAAAEVMFQTWP